MLCIILWPNQELVDDFTYESLASTKRPVDGQKSSPESVCFLSEAIWQNSHRLLINIISSGIIGKFGRPGKSAPGYSVILRCHWRDSP